jgi:hypothetical protein
MQFIKVSLFHSVTFRGGAIIMCTPGGVNSGGASICWQVKRGGGKQFLACKKGGQAIFGIASGGTILIFRSKKA